MFLSLKIVGLEGNKIKCLVVSKIDEMRDVPTPFSGGVTIRRGCGMIYADERIPRNVALACCCSAFGITIASENFPEFADNNTLFIHGRSCDKDDKIVFVPRNMFSDVMSVVSGLNSVLAQTTADMNESQLRSVQ